MSSVADAMRRLSEAKRQVKRCRRTGEPLPTQPRLFDRSPSEQAEIERVARENDEVEPFASYLAPHQYDLQKQL